VSRVGKQRELSTAGRVGDLDPRLRMDDAQLGERGRQEVGRQFQRYADTQSSRRDGDATGDCSYGLVMSFDKSVGFPQKNVAGLGRFHPGVVAVQELDSQLPLERLNRLRNGGLAHM
jgi:hypothetical protein